MGRPSEYTPEIAAAAQNVCVNAFLVTVYETSEGLLGDFLVAGSRVLYQHRGFKLRSVRHSPNLVNSCPKSLTGILRKYRGRPGDGPF